MREELQEFFVSGSDAIEVLRELINEKNIKLKTEINKPTHLAVLLTLADYLHSIGLHQSAKTLRKFADEYCQLMVSYRRKSREEIIRGLLSTQKENEEIMTKLLKRV